jgi:hypothetical protein
LEKAITYVRDERGLTYASIVLERILLLTKNLETHSSIGQVEPSLKHKKS